MTFKHLNNYLKIYLRLLFQPQAIEIKLVVTKVIAGPVARLLILHTTINGVTQLKALRGTVTLLNAHVILNVVKIGGAVEHAHINCFFDQDLMKTSIFNQLIFHTNLFSVQSNVFQR